MKYSFKSYSTYSLVAGSMCLCVAQLWITAGSAIAKETGLPIGLGGKTQSYEQTLNELRVTDYQVVKPTDTPARLSLAELQKQQAKWHESIKSFYVEFDYQAQRKQKLAKDILGEQQNKSLPGDFRLSLAYGYKSEKECSLYQELDPTKGGANHPIYKYAFNGQECRTHEPKRALGQIHPEKVSGLDGNASHYMDMINIPVGPNSAKILNTPVYIPTALQMHMFYHVLPKLENVDGFDCHVVTSGHDTFWLDDKHGCCMRRRVLFRRTTIEDPGCLHYLYACSNFAEVFPGVWAPQECHRLDFGTQMDPSTVRGVVAAVNTIKTKRIQVNNVPDSQFEIDFPPGTQVQDLVSKKAYIVPGGAELLDKAIADAQPIVGSRVMPHGFARSQLKARALWILNLAVVIVLVSVIVYRKRSLAAA